MGQNRILSMVGLAVKAGKVVSGEYMTEKAIKSFAASLVIIAEDASDNTKKHFSDMCTFYDVPLFYYSNKEEMGAAIGKEFRVSLAITDEGFGNAISKLFRAEQGIITEE